MSDIIDLLEGKPVFLDPRTADLGGAFYRNPDIQPYSPLPLRWVYDRLIIYPSVTLIDVGASTGCFTLLARHHPDMTVHAFEPVLLTHEVLRENVYLNALQDKVILNQCGVSNYDGTGILHTVIADGGKGVSIVNGAAAWHKVVEDSTIPVITIDTYCKSYKVIPTFIKIDTEGQEKLVLEGAEKTIRKYHPFLLFEYSQENADQFGLTARDTIEMIESWGYVWSNPEGMDIWATHKNWEIEIK